MNRPRFACLAGSSLVALTLASSAFASTASALDAIQAADRALETVPGAVVEIDEGRKQGRGVWEIGVLGNDGAGVELYLDRETGEVLKQSTLRLSSEQRTAPAVTAQKAMAVALGAVPGRVVELDLGTERSALVWEVLVDADAGGRFELYVDATTARIVKQERDD